MADFKYATPVALSIVDTAGSIPQGFINAVVANRHATGSITITFESGPTGAATSFELLADEQFIFESVGVPYNTVTIDATDSEASIIYTKI